jgi:hypothetical protein
MRLKILPPLICLTLLLTLTSYAQTRTASPENSANAYGVEPDTLYPGALVLELMEAAEQEIDTAVTEAYAEGYKAASLRYAPDAAMYKAIAENLRVELEAEKKKSRWLWPAAGVSAGVAFAGGFLCSFLIHR